MVAAAAAAAAAAAGPDNFVQVDLGLRDSLMFENALSSQRLQLAVVKSVFSYSYDYSHSKFCFDVQFTDCTGKEWQIGSIFKRLAVCRRASALKTLQKCVHKKVGPPCFNLLPTELLFAAVI